MNADQVASDREPTREQIKRWRKHLAEERMEARPTVDRFSRRLVVLHPACCSEGFSLVQRVH